MTDPRRRWQDVAPMPDPQARVQQLDYLGGYILALEDFLRATAEFAEHTVTYRTMRRQAGQMLHEARKKLKELKEAP